MKKILLLIICSGVFMTGHSEEIYATDSSCQNGVVLHFPSAPDINRIPKDLIGRTIMGNNAGYYDSKWKWLIAEGELKKVELLERKKIGERYSYKLNVTVQEGKGPSYKAMINVLYHFLESTKQWRIELVESLEVNIIKTGLYDSCISHRIRPMRRTTDGPLELINNSDICLQVGGRVYCNGVWEKFVEVVYGNDSIDVWGYPGRLVEDYIIDFVELR